MTTAGVWDAILAAAWRKKQYAEQLRYSRGCRGERAKDAEVTSSEV